MKRIGDVLAMVREHQQELTPIKTTAASRPRTLPQSGVLCTVRPWGPLDWPMNR